MAIYNGKNDLLLTRDLIIERSRYHLEAYGSFASQGPEQISDFNFAERIKYRRVDFVGNAITPMSKTTFYFVIFVLILVDVVQKKYQQNLNNSDD